MKSLFRNSVKQTKTEVEWSGKVKCQIRTREQQGKMIFQWKFFEKNGKKVLGCLDSIWILKRYLNQSLKNTEKNRAYTKTICCEKGLRTSFNIPTRLLEPKIMDSVSFIHFSPVYTDGKCVFFSIFCKILLLQKIVQFINSSFFLKWKLKNPNLDYLYSFQKDFLYSFRR